MLHDHIRGRSAALCLTSAIVAIFAAANATAFARVAPPQVSQVADEVTLETIGEPSHRAALYDSILDGTGIETRADSRLELTYPDGKFIRYAPSTTACTANADETTLGNGAALLHVPKTESKTTITTRLITASTTDGTFALETFKFPATSSGNMSSAARYRVTVLEGTVCVCHTEARDNCVTVEAKQALIGSFAKPLGEVVRIDLAIWMNSNPLVTGFTSMNAQIFASLDIPRSGLMQPVVLRSVGDGTAKHSSSLMGRIDPGNLSTGTNEVSPSEEAVIICHQGQTLTLPRAAAEAHREKHPGDSLGACR